MVTIVLLKSHKLFLACWPRTLAPKISVLKMLQDQACQGWAYSFLSPMSRVQSYTSMSSTREKSIYRPKCFYSFKNNTSHLAKKQDYTGRILATSHSRDGAGYLAHKAWASKPLPPFTEGLSRNWERGAGSHGSPHKVAFLKTWPISWLQSVKPVPILKQMCFRFGLTISLPGPGKISTEPTTP